MTAGVLVGVVEKGVDGRVKCRHGGVGGIGSGPCWALRGHKKIRAFARMTANQKA